MTIHLNPLAQAEAEIHDLLAEEGHQAVGKLLALKLVGIMKRMLDAEILMRGVHPDCGATNPAGKRSLCDCPCHKGHFRHFWKQINATPQINPDGVTYHIIERCRFCPDVKLVIIKAGFKNEKHGVVSLEYLIRGEGRVLTREEWHERKPEPQTGEFLRKVGL